MAIPMDGENMNGKQWIFVDTSAFKAVFDRGDDFHQKALHFWETARKERKIWITSNFILDETYTLIRVRMGKKAWLGFYQDLLESGAMIRIFRITVGDEKEALRYFENLPGKDLSFTDCTSFALMRRLDLKEVFAFDEHFPKAGFNLLP